MKQPTYEERIRYDKDWNGHGEHFVFEGKWTNETEWQLDSAFPLLDYNGEDCTEKGALIHYTAITKIRELMKLGIPFYFFSK